MVLGTALAGLARRRRPGGATGAPTSGAGRAMVGCGLGDTFFLLLN